MLEKIIRRPFYKEKHLKAPLLEERLTYLKPLYEQGRTLNYIKMFAEYLLRIVEFLKLKTKRIVTHKEIEKAANCWAKYKYNHPQKQKAFSIYSKNAFVTVAENWLKMIGCLESPPNNVALLYKIFERKNALYRHLNAPLLDERIKYLQYWANNGAKNQTLRRTAQYLLLIIDYLNLANKLLITPVNIEKAAEKWAAATKNKPIRRKADYSVFAKRRFIYDATNWLKMLNRLVIDKPKILPFSNKLTGYINYIQQELGLSEKTVYSRKFILHDFLTLVWNKAGNLEQLSPVIMDKIIAHKRDVDKYSRRTIQSYITIARTFLKYAGDNEWCSKKLAASIKISRIYKHENLPCGPSWDDVKKILAKTEGDYPTNIRDRAIIMLLAIYGLRCSEVVDLKLDDIDWRNNLLKLNRAKDSKSQVFPLSKIVGAAILRYISKVRQNSCSQRNIFICRNAPYRPLAPSTIYQVVARKYKELNIKIKHRGPHSLRHACATHLINTGVSLKEISDHLGHQNLDTTRIYAKVNLAELRNVVSLDIGGLV